MNSITGNPYIGPRTFLKEEGHLFFGRDRESRDLSALVLSEKLLLFYAQSGAGKSSLINTRLIPELEHNLYEVLPVARVSGDLPEGFEAKNIYAYNLMRSLIRREIEPDSLADLSLSQFLMRLNEDENGYFYDGTLANPIRGSMEISPWRRALIIDQFEEIFNTHLDAWEKREEFFRQLAQAMQDDPFLSIVLVMREDYIASLDPYAHLLPDRLRIRYYMQRFRREAAIKAVKRPAEKIRAFAPGVAEKLVEDLASIRVQKPNGKQTIYPGQYIEPVQLQVVCFGLWENLTPRGKQITEKDLQQVGDVNQSLERYYDERISVVVKEMGIPERLIREWFDKELITSEGNRNMVLRDPNNKGGLNENVIQALQGGLVQAEMRGGQIWYELSHDRLIEPVRNSNAKWFEQNLSLFQRQVVLWIQQGHSESLLLRSNELQDAEKDAERMTLTKDEQDFLEACRVLRRREQRDQFQRRIIVAALIVSVLLLVAAVFSYSNARQAQSDAEQAQSIAVQEKTRAEEAQAAAQTSEAEALKQKENAEEQANRALAGSLAAQAESLNNSNHALALLLALEAYQREPNLLTRTTLFQILRFSAYTRLFGFNESVNSIVISPNGKWIAASSSDQISIIDSETHQILSNITGDLGIVNSLTLNSDGTLLAAGGCVPEGCSEPKGQITIWDMSNPKEPRKLIGVGDRHSAQIKAIAFSPDGKYLASGSYDRTIILWDASTPGTLNASGEPMQDQTRGGLVTSLAFSPDGKTLASASDDGSIHLWNVSTPATVTLIGIAPSQHTSSIYSIAFSRDGTKFASASDDTTVALWEWNKESLSLQNPIKLEVHRGFVRSVVFNADGTVLASAGFDSTIVLWDTSTGEQIGPPLRVHSRPINTIVFGVAETQDVLLSGSDDRTMILWDLSTRQPLSQPVKEISPPADIGQTARSGEIEATAEGQQIKLTGRSEPLTDHTGVVTTLNFSLQQIDGRLLLASASDDQTVILWDVSNVSRTDVFLKLEGFESPVTAAYFKDGKLVTSEGNGVTTQWIIDPEDWTSLACEIVNRNLTSSVWDQFLQSLNEQSPKETCVNQP